MKKDSNKHRPPRKRKGPSQSELLPISATVNLPAYPHGIEPPPSRGYTYKRVFLLSLQAIFNAIIIGFIAKAMVALIDLVTNLFFYGKFSFDPAAPGISHLGIFVIFIPIIGGLIVGFMARFGSPGIRGHGIPEAMEQILLNESKIKPIITFLKPISAAISIGTGGPFGAEGPIISGGGALGSFAGQIMTINSTERKIMLTAGACGGMAAIFGCPIAGILLGVELLLFEFSPRSLIPVALSCATGAAMRFLLFGAAPIFAMPAIPSPNSLAIIIYTIFGVIIGVAAAYASKAIYFLEDIYKKLPIHWMWWPALGAVVVGIIGYFAPKTMGVGYDNVRLLLTGNIPLYLLFVLCILKFISWSFSLASGTSGGTLAPLFTIGGALGAFLSITTLYFFPHSGINIATAALIGMAAMFAGASRAILTSIVFALETTGEMHGLLPLVGACTAAYFVSFFLMKGSIMTEKMERHGLTPPGTFKPDILEQINIKQVFDKRATLINLTNTIKETREWIRSHNEAKFNTYIIADDNTNLLGLVQRKDIFSNGAIDDASISSIISNKRDAYIYPNNPLSLAIDIMDKYKLDVLPVVTRTNRRKVLGQISREKIFSIYSERKNENITYKQSISLKNRSMRMIVRGRQLFHWEKSFEEQEDPSK